MVACCAMADAELYPRPLPDLTEDDRPDVSLVVPVFNEERTIEQVVQQAIEVLETDTRTFEVIVVDDGSRDGTWAAVEHLHAGDARVKAVRFKRNFGQHPAMHAGTLPSRLINGMLRRFTAADISDFGCAFNAYSRDAITPVLGVIGKQKFTKALVLAAGAQAVEVDLDHRAREDKSRYSPLRLTRLALHVLAGFWPQPIQWAGVLLGVLCGTFALVVAVWATVVWPLHGDFPGQLYLGGLVLGVLAIQGFILALVGEYLGRIQRDVEGRPLYTIEQELV
jgi:undecaprenyl-phosphate 4-deoxy-4-formamido-L-arabinose transferase